MVFLPTPNTIRVNVHILHRMSLDDVVIIMSIPRRLVLTTRRQKQEQTNHALNKIFYS